MERQNQLMFVIIKRILCVGFIIFTVILLYQDFLLFRSLNTNTSNFKQKMGPGDFPSILVCPTPAFDIFKLRKYGYHHSFDYARGKIQHSKVIGWTGQSNLPPGEVMANVSVLKTASDCPHVKVYYEKYRGEYIDEEVDVELTRSFHPHGKCCRVTEN